MGFKLLGRCISQLPGSPHEPITVVFADSAYAPVLWNWLAAPGVRGLQRLLVVALDPELHARLQQQGITSFAASCNGLDELWLLRLEVIGAILQLGIDVIHSDVDAVWLHDPLPAVRAIEGDLVISQGTIHPPDVLAAWGLVCCCGFFLVRATKAGRALFSRIAEDCQAAGSDQTALNRALLADGVAWSPPRDGYTLEARGHSFTCSRELRLGIGRQYHVALLPHHAYQRLPMPGEDAVVCHPLAPKNADSKRRVLEQAGCLVYTGPWT